MSRNPGPCPLETLGVAGYKPSKGDLSVSDAFADYWSRLAASGDPNDAGALPWRRWDQAKDPYLELDSPLATGSGVRTVRTKQCDFWDLLTGG